MKKLRVLICQDPSIEKPSNIWLAVCLEDFTIVQHNDPGYLVQQFLNKHIGEAALRKAYGCSFEKCPAPEKFHDLWNETIKSGLYLSTNVHPKSLDYSVQSKDEDNFTPARELDIADVIEFVLDTSLFTAYRQKIQKEVKDIIDDAKRSQE